jgi:hypothetical protein
MSALYGLMAELRTPEELLAAARRAREAGFARVEAYAPFPVEGLGEAVGFTKTRVPLATLLGGIAGGLGGFFLQWYSAVIDYPINSGGRPLDSWPEFIPVTFETTVLGAAIFAVAAMLLGNGLPRLRHPVFNVREFELATRNRFFLCLRGEEGEAARTFLAQLRPMRVLEVPL